MAQETFNQGAQSQDVLIEKDFNATRYLTNIKGKAYLPVAARIAWFRHLHPDGIIETTPHSITPEIAIFHARVTTTDGASATGYGSCTPGQFPDGWIEKAETKALGRALASLGLGTLATDDFEDADFIADAPAGQMQPMQQRPPQQQNGYQQQRPPQQQGGYQQQQGGNFSGPKPASDAQKGKIRYLKMQSQVPDDVFVTMLQQQGNVNDIDALTSRDASKIIDLLQGGAQPQVPSNMRS